MKINTWMPLVLKPYYKAELSLYKTQLNTGNLVQAWNHLERAHVIGQAYPWEHSYAHWKMLLFGFKIKSVKEIVGQIPRLLIGGIKSFVVQIPVGNTGGANIPPLRSLPIEPDLKKILNLELKKN